MVNTQTLCVIVLECLRIVCADNSTYKSSNIMTTQTDPDPLLLVLLRGVA